jgi:uncharacterized protein
MLDVTFLLLAIGYYKGVDIPVIKAAGYFGLITALLGWYNAVTVIWHKENSWTALPSGQFPWAVKPETHKRKIHSAV